MAQVAASYNSTPLFLVVTVCCSLLSFVTFGGSALLSFVLGAGCLFSPVTGDSPLFTIFGCSLSAVSGYLLSPIASNCPLSTISGPLLSFVAGSSILYIIFGSGPLFAISGSSFLSLMPFASSRVLFLLCTLSHMHCSFLPFLLLIHSFLLFLPIPLARNSALHIEKSLFNQTFIIQRPITSR